MTLGYRNMPSIPKWLIPLLAVGIFAIFFVGPLLDTFNSIFPLQTDQNTEQIVEPLFAPKDYGQKMEVEGSNLLTAGTIKNTKELNEKITQQPGYSYIQDNDDVSIISISAKKEDLESLKARINEFTVSFKINRGADKINILPDLSAIPEGTKRISFATSLFSNLKPTKESYLAKDYIEDVTKDGKIYPSTYSVADWDKSKTIYLRVFLYKKSATIQ